MLSLPPITFEGQSIQLGMDDAAGHKLSEWWFASCLCGKGTEFPPGKLFSILFAHPALPIWISTGPDRVLTPKPSEALLDFLLEAFASHQPDREMACRNAKETTRVERQWQKFARKLGRRSANENASRMADLMHRYIESSVKGKRKPQVAWP